MTMRYFTALILVALFLGILSCEKKEEDNPPVASFTASPESGPFTTLFNFDGTASRDDEDPAEDLRVRWDWNGDGDFDTQYSSNKIVTHRYDEVGDFDVMMEVINSKGWTDQDVMTITVYADSTSPTAFFMVDPDTASVNTIFAFDASNSYDPNTPLSELKFRWDWQGDGIWDTPFFCDTNVYHKYVIPGDYRAIMEVKNYINLTDTTSRKIHVYDI